MSALRETTPGVGSGNGVPVSGRSPQPRRPTAARPVGAAGVQRRSLQRDLARREANLRINRRVSGAAAGIVRPPLAGPASTAVEAPAPQQRMTSPRPAAPQQHPPASPASPGPYAPGQRTAPSARPAAPARGMAPQSRAGIGAPSRQSQPQPQARVAPATRPAAPYGVGQAAALAAALSEPAFVAPRPAPTPQRPILTTLPGGAIGEPARKDRRLSNPAILVAAFVLLVVTVGAVVALQIGMTQISEQRGADLGKITTLQQKNIALKEGIGRLVSASRVDDAATASGLVEPSVEDVRYLSRGDRTALAAKAARVLKTAPVAPTAAQAAAAATAAAAQTPPSTSAPATIADSGTAQ